MNYRAQSPSAPQTRQPSDHASILGWGLVGASSAAAYHLLPALRSLSPLVEGKRHPTTNSLPLGIFSHSEHRARAFAEIHAVPHAYINLADMLARPDIRCVYVGNHPRHHAQAALAALAAGKHVFCEPPLALTVDEAQTVAHTALSRGLRLAVNYPRRADPAIRTLRELLADHTIGDLLGGRVSHARLLPSPRQTWRLRANGGGVLLDQSLHTIDLLRYLLRDEVSEVYCHSSALLLGDEVEEDVVSQLTWRRSGIVLQTHDSYVVPHAPTSIEFYGSTGTLLARHCFDDDQLSELWLHRHGHVTPIPLQPSVNYEGAIQAFAAAVRGEGAPLAGGADGVAGLSIISAAQESIRRAHHIPVAQPTRTLIDRSLF